MSRAAGGVLLMSGIFLKENQAGERDRRDLAVVASEALSEEVAVSLELTTIAGRVHLPLLRIHFLCVYLYGSHFLYPTSPLLCVVLPASRHRAELNTPFIDVVSPTGVLLFTLAP